MTVLAVVSTEVIPPEKICSDGGSTVTVIVPDVYPVPPSAIVSPTTLPPVDRTAVPTPDPESNATVGASV